MTYDENAFEQELDEALATVKEMLLAKNRAYGDSALRGSSVAPASLSIKIRMLDKMRRIESGQPDEVEDVWSDLLGYGVLLAIAETREMAAQLGLEQTRLMATQNTREMPPVHPPPAFYSGRRATGIIDPREGSDDDGDT